MFKLFPHHTEIAACGHRAKERPARELKKSTQLFWKKMNLIKFTVEEAEYLLDIDKINFLYRRSEETTIYLMGDDDPFIIKGEQGIKLWEYLESFSYNLSSKTVNQEIRGTSAEYNASNQAPKNREAVDFNQ